MLFRKRKDHVIHAEDILEDQEQNDRLARSALLDETYPEEGQEGTTEEKKESLTRSQKIRLLWAGVFSFLFFFFLLFPYSILLRKAIESLIAPGKIEASVFDPALFSPTKAKNMKLTMPGNLVVATNELFLDVSTLSLLLGNLSGNAYARYLDFQSDQVGARTDLIDLQSDLTGIRGPLKGVEGQIHINVANLQFHKFQFMGLQSLMSPSDLLIEKGKIQIQLKDEAFQFFASRIYTNLFVVDITEGGKLGNTLDSTVLNLKVCLIPEKDLETINPDIFQLYRMATGSGIPSEESAEKQSGGVKKTCYRIGGRIQNPSARKIE